MLPFLLWDVIYTVKNVLFGDNVAWKNVLFDFLTGRAAAPLYYILVLFQLTLLTPFILKKAGKKWLYLITPVYLCVIYIWTVVAGAPPRLYGTVFPAWLLFYLLGIDCRAGRLERYVQKSSGVWVIVAVGIELLETIVLYVGACSITLASSQLKFSSCLYAATILLCLKKNEDKVQCNTWISNIGDCSFGIFFLHCYAQQVEDGFLIHHQNYQSAYKGKPAPSDTPMTARKRLEEKRPNTFIGRSFGVGDVIVWDEEKERKFFYVDKEELVEFGGFMDADAAGNTVVYMVPNYQIDGKTGTWLPYDSEVVEGVCFFMMRNEQRKDTASPIVVDSKGVFVTDAPNGFENVRAVLAEYVHRAEKKQQDMTEHEKCLTNGTYERARESGTEQNYDMIDGCVNNVPKKPRRIGGRWSVLDRLHIKQAERKQKEQTQQQQQERSRRN